MLRRIRWVTVLEGTAATTLLALLVTLFYGSMIFPYLHRIIIVEGPMADPDKHGGPEPSAAEATAREVAPVATGLLVARFTEVRPLDAALPSPRVPREERGRP